MTQQITDPRRSVVYWTAIFPPLTPSRSATITIEATSARVPGTIRGRDALWDRCYRDLMDRVRERIEQEIARLGGDCARVLSETVEPRHDDALGEAWMYGRFHYELYRSAPRT
jgi:hypothetical protein